jgi:hypothetical protein
MIHYKITPLIEGKPAVKLDVALPVTNRTGIAIIHGKGAWAR